MSDDAKHILLVEDEEAIRELMQLELSELGHRVGAVADGNAARDYLAAHVGDLDLVVLDLNIPRVSGRELLQEIAARRPDLPVLVCTGLDGGIDPLALEVEARVVDVLRKPFKLATFSDMVTGILAA